MKKALVLAGGLPQIDLIKKLKKRGYFVILADYFENPIAKEYCDLFYQASTLDNDLIYKIAKENSVDLVITVCTDQALLTAADVSERLNLPFYISYKTALNVTNKKYMKVLFAQSDIPTAKFKIIKDLDELDIKRFAFPLIIKPVDCNSSKGVTKIYEYKDLIKSFDGVKSLSRTREVIIEEYIEGEEITADFFVYNKQVTLLSSSNNIKIPSNNSFIIQRTANPLKASLDNELVDIANKIVKAFELNNCPLLIQLLYANNKLYVIEFSARTGGGIKHCLINNVCGFDVISSTIDICLNEKINIKLNKRKYKIIHNDFIYTSDGVFDSLYGFEKMKKEKIILDYYLFKTKGAKLANPQNSGSRIAGVTFVGETIDEIIKKRELFNLNVKVLDSNKIDIMRHDILNN